jgi:hypothetical protein
MNENIPELKVIDTFNVNLKKVLLAEFSQADVKELIKRPVRNTEMNIFPKKEMEVIASIKGLRLHKVIGQNHKIVSSYDPETDSIPLDFVSAKGVIFACASASENEYKWKLIKTDAPLEDGKTLPITGIKFANKFESSELNKIFPNWLNKCKEYDEKSKNNLPNMTHSLAKFNYKDNTAIS